MNDKIASIGADSLKTNPYVAEFLKKIRGGENQPSQNGTAAFLALGNGQPNSCWEVAGNNNQVT